MLDLSQGAVSHPSKEILEEYVFHRLPEALAAPVEEHLLICHPCQDALAATDDFVSAMKYAAKERDRVPFLQSVSRFATIKVAFAPLLILAMVAILTVRKHSREPLTEAAVSLSSLRGPSPVAVAPAGKPLLLTIESRDLAIKSGYRVEVVDAGGEPVWKGPVTVTGGELVASMPNPLGEGVYWVRLYGNGPELLREFGMSAK